MIKYIAKRNGKGKMASAIKTLVVSDKMGNTAEVSVYTINGRISKAYCRVNSAFCVMTREAK